MTHQVGVKGKKHIVPAFRFDDCIIIAMGKFVRIAEVFDQKWLLADNLPDPHRILQQLRCADQIPDLFTFFQRVPDTKPRFDFHMEWDNVAAIPVSTYDNWLRTQISKKTRERIRQSERKGVTVRVEQYNERYVHGIMAIYDESRIRAGRKFPHYGKDFATVREENGTYLERSTFLGAYFENEMIGYLKIVWDRQTAGIMEIVSKIALRDKGPNNALLSEAVRLCAERGVKYLLYGHFIYGSKGEDSLTSFKKRNGFVSIDLPRYYVPLTLKGNIALRFGLHRDLKDFMPMWLRRPLIDIRRKWYGNELDAD